MVCQLWTCNNRQKNHSKCCIHFSVYSTKDFSAISPRVDGSTLFVGTQPQLTRILSSLFSNLSGLVTWNPIVSVLPKNPPDLSLESVRHQYTEKFTYFVSLKSQMEDLIGREFRSKSLVWPLQETWEISLYFLFSIYTPNFPSNCRGNQNKLFTWYWEMAIVCQKL